MKKEKILELCALGCLFAAYIVLCVFMWERASYMLDSDCSSEMVLAKFLSNVGGIMSDRWYYSTEIRVINTQLVWALLFRIIDNWRVVRFIGSIVCYALMAFSYLYMCRQLKMKNTAAYLSAMVLLLPTSEMYREFVFVNMGYVVYFIQLFLLMGMLVKMTRVSKRIEAIGTLVAMGVISVFVGMTGLRLFLVFYIPVVFAALVWCVWRFANESGTEKEKIMTVLKGIQGRFLGASIFVSAMAAIGIVYHSKVLSVKYTFYGFDYMQYSYFSWDPIETVINWSLEALGYCVNLGLFDALVYNAVAFLVLFAVIIFVGCLLKAPKKYVAEIQILDIFFVSNLLLFIAFYTFSDMSWTHARYVLPIMIFALPILAMHLSNKCTWYKHIVSVVLIVLVIVSSYQRYTLFWQLDKTRDQRDVAAFVTEQGYEEGYATFWNANILTELSNGEVDMRSWIGSDNGESMGKIKSVNDIYHWLQLAEHTETIPEDKFFIMLTHVEKWMWPLGIYLPEENLIYRNETYCVYGFDAYEQLAPELIRGE